MKVVTDIFYQSYNLQEDGIPPHWAVQWYNVGSAFPEYFLCDTYEEAIAFAKEHGYEGDK